MEWPPLSLILITSLLPTLTLSGDFTLGMDSETTCTKRHYYKPGDVFTASANGRVYDGGCTLIFLQSGMWGDEKYEACLSVCVKILSYTMESCNVEMAYHDGVNDYSPVTFDCHTFPPVMWCSSKNELKVSVAETKNYQGRDYAITLEVKPFCGSLDEKTTDAGVLVILNEDPKKMNKTALIIGAIVGTVSILFVLGTILYCYKKRQSEEENEEENAERYPQDRRYRSTTPNQPVNRYAPIGFHVPASSQSSSDPGGKDPYLSHSEIPHLNGEVKRPFHDPLQPQLSNPSHMTGGGDPWYHMSTMGPAVQEIGPAPIQQAPPMGQPSQYLLQNKVYNYPQFNSTEAAPDTRFVVYDFDYPAPSQRKYSGSKMNMGPARDSPVRDMDRLRGQEPQRGLPPIDSTTTDHTSDNDDSSYSVTTEDETTTDDQMSPVKGHMYNPAGPPYGYGAMINRDPNARFYNPSNFQSVPQRNMTPADSRMDPQPMYENNSAVNTADVRMYPQPQMSENNSAVNNEQNSFYRNPAASSAPQSLPSNQGPPPLPRNTTEPKVGPKPQVPSPQVPTTPRHQVEQQTSPQVPMAPRHQVEQQAGVGRNEELPWPHNPPPAYTQTDSGDSDGAQII